MKKAENKRGEESFTVNSFLIIGYIFLQLNNYLEIMLNSRGGLHKETYLGCIRNLKLGIRSVGEYFSKGEH
ncbi:hypothetical protein ACM26V_04025 [Salipaludibacillus sp. HK11]|uniref:hypothetical protein n=1 Tax=Salipaludibacillus sp. HK11 TaxID=3394320 RepID=UPI0039FCAFCD